MNWKRTIAPSLIVFASHTQIIAPVFLGILFLGVLGAGLSSAPASQLMEGFFAFVLLAACTLPVMLLISALGNFLFFRGEKEAWLAWLVTTGACVIVMEIAPVAWFALSVSGSQ